MQDKQKKAVKATSGYKGNVTVKKTKNGKVKGVYTNHNAGTQYFFEQLNKLLVGIDTTNNMPKYIDCGYATDGNSAKISDFNSVLVRRVPITSKTVRSWADEQGTQRYTTVLSGLVTYLDISDQSGIKRIALFPTTGTENTNMLANVALDFSNSDDDTEAESGIKLDVGEALLVEWSMSFDNVVEAAE